MCGSVERHKTEKICGGYPREHYRQEKREMYINEKKKNKEKREELSIN